MPSTTGIVVIKVSRLTGLRAPASCCALLIARVLLQPSLRFPIFTFLTCPTTECPIPNSFATNARLTEPVRSGASYLIISSIISSRAGLRFCQSSRFEHPTHSFSIATSGVQHEFLASNSQLPNKDMVVRNDLSDGRFEFASPRASSPVMPFTQRLSRKRDQSSSGELTFASSR